MRAPTSIGCDEEIMLNIPAFSTHLYVEASPMKISTTLPVELASVTLVYRVEPVASNFWKGR